MFTRRLLGSRRFFVNKSSAIFQNCRHRLSTQATQKSPDLLIKLIGGSLVIGGTSWIVYNNVNKKSEHTEMNHVEESNEVTRLVDHLPEHVSYLIVGGGTAAFSASRAIRSNDPGSKVLLVSEESYLPYMRPPLSKELWFSGIDLDKEFTFRQWNGKDRSIFFEYDEFYLPLKDYATSKNGGISVVTGHTVVKIDATERRAYLDNGQVIIYDKCLLATGGRPKNLSTLENLPKEAQNRVILFRSIKDFKKLEKAISSSESITIIGGGFLGSELACSLAEKSRRLKSRFSINQIIGEPGVLHRVLPSYLSDWCTSKIKDEGVNVLTNTQIKEAQLNDNQLCLKLTNGKTVISDCAIVAVGLEPNVDLAVTSDLEVDDVLGGYRVNSELQIRSNLWAAGDATCFYDQKLGRRRVEHHDHAVVSGRLAGENMTGAGKPYWHQSMFWSDLGTDIGFEAIGVIDSSLPTYAFFAQDEKASQVEEDAKKYNKGVIFYLRNESVVGIVLWNLYNNMHTARRVINDGVRGQDLNEVAKLFSLNPKEEDDDPKQEVDSKEAQKLEKTN